MKYLQFFEKFGISKNLEDQCKSYFDEIKENPTKNNFDFLFQNNTGEYQFKVKIGKFDGKTLGRYNLSLDSETGKINNIIIYLKDRNNYSTLLHELKHLDYATRKPSFYKDIFHKSKETLGELRGSKKLIFAEEVFYLLDTNEFESRYHGYYADFDDFISNNISKNPTPSEIYNLFEKFLAGNQDKSWTWYTKDDEFKFEDYLTSSQINRLFHQFVYIKDFYKDEYDNVIKYLKSQIKKAFKSSFNKYTKEELLEINRTKKMIESKINKRLPKFRKKFFRLVSIMIDKWCK